MTKRISSLMSCSEQMVDVIRMNGTWRVTRQYLRRRTRKLEGVKGVASLNIVDEVRLLLSTLAQC